MEKDKLDAIIRLLEEVSDGITELNQAIKAQFLTTHEISGSDANDLLGKFVVNMNGC